MKPPSIPTIASIVFASRLKNGSAKIFAAALLCAGGINIHAVEPVTRQIFSSGDSSHRFTVTVLSEGYRETEQEQFFQDATNLVSSFFSAEPFREYQNYFNAQAVFVPSIESGSDHPAYPVTRNTFFNSSYDNNDRLLTIPTGAEGVGKVTSILKAAAPGTDLSVVLVNDLVYGGSGGAVVVVSKSAFAPEILIHESGHTLAGLGDEYTDASSYIPPSEPPNTTRQTDRNKIKWNAWISTNTPIPTPALAEFESLVGLFEGAQNRTTGWYRPRLDCGMRTLGKPFCEICRETLVKSISGKTRLIDGFAPQSLVQVVRSLEPLSFEVTPLAPSTHSLEMQWFLDDAPIPDATNNAFILDPDSLPKGSHHVRVELRDPTDWVRNDPANSLKQSLDWRIDKQFPEATRPTVKILSPAQGARLTDSLVTISGVSADNIAIAQVLYQIGDVPFVPVAGTTSWNTAAQLLPGRNVVRVKSLDISGNESLVQTRVLNYVAVSPLQLLVNGEGSISGASNGQLLEIGRMYRLTARPAAGHLFAGWNGGIVADSAQLSFVMQSNLALNASFVVNPFLTSQGEYVGLFRNDEAVDVDTSGLIRIKVRRDGSFSGRLSMVDRDFPFAGKFRWDKQTELLVKRTGTTPLQLEMVLDENSKRIQGTLSETNWQASLRAEFASPSDPAWIGQRFTIALPGEVTDSSSLGDSIGSIAVGAKTLRASGVLANGNRFTQSISLGQAEWPLFWRGRGGGMALGWVENGSIETAPFTGEIDFLKRPSASFYSDGVNLRSQIQASLFQRPLIATDRVLEFTRSNMIFEGGNLAEPFAAEIFLQSQNRLTLSETNSASLRLNLQTGLLNGSFRHPVSGSKALVYGVLLQNQTNVAGLFLGTNETGRITLEVIE